MRIEDKIKQLGLVLPEPSRPVAAYIPATFSGNMVFTAGQLPVAGGEMQYSGRLGEDLTVEDGYNAAKICALNCLAAVKSVIGDLDLITRIVKLTGYVNSGADFTDQPKVINGASELLVELFGDYGRHARSAVGVAALPLNAAVEIEMVVEAR